LKSATWYTEGYPYQKSLLPTLTRARPQCRTADARGFIPTTTMGSRRMIRDSVSICVPVLILDADEAISSVVAMLDPNV